MEKELIAINFKGMGVKAFINRDDYDPDRDMLWDDDFASDSNPEMVFEPEVKPAKRMGRPPKVAV